MTSLSSGRACVWGRPNDRPTTRVTSATSNVAARGTANELADGGIPLSGVSAMAYDPAGNDGDQVARDCSTRLNHKVQAHLIRAPNLDRAMGAVDMMPTVRIPFAIPRPKTRPFDVAGFGRNSIDLVAVV